MSDRPNTAFILAALLALVLWLNNSPSPNQKSNSAFRSRLMDIVDVLLGRSAGGGGGQVPGTAFPSGSSLPPVLLPPVPVKINGRVFSTDGSLTDTDLEETRRIIERINRENKQ